FRRIEAEPSGARNSTYLFGGANANDGPRHRWIAQSPRNRHFTRARVVTIADRPQSLNEVQIARQERFLEIGVTLAPVVLRQVSNALACHSAAQQSGMH